MGCGITLIPIMCLMPWPGTNHCKQVRGKGRWEGRRGAVGRTKPLVKRGQTTVFDASAMEEVHGPDGAAAALAPLPRRQRAYVPRARHPTQGRQSSRPQPNMHGCCTEAVRVWFGVWRCVCAGGDGALNAKNAPARQQQQRLLGGDGSVRHHVRQAAVCGKSSSAVTSCSACSARCDLGQRDREVPK